MRSELSCMSFALFWLLAGGFLVPFAWAQGEEVCPLCETATTIPVRFDYHVGGGRTCLNVYVDIAPLAPDGQACKAQQNSYRQACCGAAEPPLIPSAPVSAPTYNGPQGDEPDCPICGTLEYPGIPTAFIKARYVGDYNCGQLYDRGLNGLIPFFMCLPLQDYAETVCGCGQYNPKCQADPTKCWGYDGPTPTPPQPTPVNSPPVRPPSPVAMPQTETISTEYGDRKIRPSTGKTGATRLSGSSRGGSAGRLRSGRQLVKGETLFEHVLEGPVSIKEVEDMEKKQGGSLRAVNDGTS